MTWRKPINNCSGVPVTGHPGSFGFQRKDMTHTGVDLYTISGEAVYACEDGVIVGKGGFTGEQVGSPWWNDTDYIMLEGESGVICYGEMTVLNSMPIGESIIEGELLGFVSRVIKKGNEHYDIPGWSPAMLHLELYPHGTTEPTDNIEDVLDPTEFLLNIYRNTLTRYW